MEGVPESVREVVSGALVAAEPPAPRALAVGAVPGGRDEFAEDPQVIAVEDAGGGGDEGGARARVQRRGVADCVAAGPGAGHAGDVLGGAVSPAPAGGYVPPLPPGSGDQAADPPAVRRRLGGPVTL